LIIQNVYNQLAMSMAYTSAYVFMSRKYFIKKIKVTVENNTQQK